MRDMDAERGNVEVRIRWNVEVETPLKGQTAVVLRLQMTAIKQASQLPRLGLIVQVTSIVSC